MATKRRQLIPDNLPVVRVQIVRELQAQPKPLLISDSTDAGKIIAKYLEQEDREHFVILMLDVRNQLLGIHTVSIGILNATIVAPREVFKAAILANAASIILGHNHPSGDLTPSTEDIEVTTKLCEAGQIIGINVLDHVIVSAQGKSASLQKQGWIKGNGRV